MLKYQELVRTLLDELAQGVYQKGDRLPTTLWREQYHRQARHG